MKKKLIVILFAFILVIAVLTNPSKEDFTSWAKEKIKQQDETILNIDIELFGDKLINSSTKTNNYVFFSTFHIDITNNEKIKVLGFFNNFVPISKDIRDALDTNETGLSSNNSLNENNKSNIFLLDYPKSNPIKNMKSFTYDDENQQINVKLKDGDTSIAFGKDHPNGIKLTLIRDDKGIPIDLGEVDNEILDEYGELADIENYSIQVGSHDFNNDGVEEIIIAIGDGLIHGQLWVYSYHKVDDIFKINPLHLELNESFQSEVMIDDNKIYLPYGSQGLFEEFVWYEDRFLQ